MHNCLIGYIWCKTQTIGFRWQ
uniref:Uncharacterized protein n=1 Tax=Rhizophora mucronata TaxID=61149 RepID=A0A2P2Q0F7_RHIMU